MLDFQINESITNAYLKGVCGKRKCPHKGSRFKKRMFEDVNDVPSTVSSTASYDAIANEEDIEGIERGLENISNEMKQWERDDSAFKRDKDEYDRQLKRDIENHGKYVNTMEKAKEEDEKNNQQYITASNDRYAGEANHPKLTSGDNSQSIHGYNPKEDPGLRIGNDVYRGIAYAAPMMGVAKAGGTAKGIGKNILYDNYLMRPWRAGSSIPANVGRTALSMGTSYLAKKGIDELDKSSEHLPKWAGKQARNVNQWLAFIPPFTTGSILRNVAGAASGGLSDVAKHYGYYDTSDKLNKFSEEFGDFNTESEDTGRDTERKDTILECPKCRKFEAPNQKEIDRHYINSHGYDKERFKSRDWYDEL